MDSGFAWGRHHLGQAYEQKRMYTEALAEMRQALAVSAVNNRHLARVAHILAVSGKRSEAQINSAPIPQKLLSAAKW
jgi:Flp pilus assembly protein TadD